MVGMTDRVWYSIAWPCVGNEYAVDPSIEWRDLPRVNVVPINRAGFDHKRFREYIRAAYPDASYSGLSKRLGVTAPTIRHLMIGKHGPSLFNYLMLCALLEVPFGSFLVDGQITPPEFEDVVDTESP